MFQRLRSSMASGLLFVAFAQGAAAAPMVLKPARVATKTPPSYAQLGALATSALTQSWFVAGRGWRICLHAFAACNARNSDWGADSLTFALFQRWNTTHDASLAPYFHDLDQSAPYYGDPCKSVSNCSTWSDIPVWDSIAASREYTVTNDALALSKAKAAFNFVDGSGAYGVGACPSIDYQRPGGGNQYLKTLETDSNYVKAALLLYAATHEAGYLTKAAAKYAAIRKYFLDPRLALYTVYVFDQNGSCTQVPHRFFASVNGNMISNGLMLYAATHDAAYANDAVATGYAVAANLSDANGVLADLQADNDIVAPLIEGMQDLFANGQVFAGRWILQNASAAAGELKSNGSYGRFFDGPVSNAMITAFETNGGFAVEIAAASIAGAQTVAQQTDWSLAKYVSKTLTIGDSITFSGSAISFIGTIGERCCSQGHARVYIDGVETVDGSGIWQNKSASSQPIPNSVMFAWRWPSAGVHTISFGQAVPNAKEGGSYLNLTGYFVK